jgi:hypothetical protein
MVYRLWGVGFDRHLNFKGLFITGVKVKMQFVRILQNFAIFANTSITDFILFSYFYYIFLFLL